MTAIIILSILLALSMAANIFLFLMLGKTLIGLKRAVSVLDGAVKIKQNETRRKRRRWRPKK